MATATKPRITSSSDEASPVLATARSAKRPALAAGAAAAGLVGGFALGMKGRRRGLSGMLSPRPRVLGVPIGRKSGLQRTVGKVARELGSATKQMSSTTDDIRQVREELEKANRQSPVEVLLNALTHRRGMNKREQ